MDKEILINAGAGEIRVALVEDGKLQELFLERVIGLEDGPLKKRTDGRHGHSLIGNIMLGRVQRVLPEAAEQVARERTADCFFAVP